MDDWTYHYPEIEVPDPQSPLLKKDGRVREARRARAQQTEAGHVARLEQTQARDEVGNHAESDVPLPFATPPGAALTL